MLNNSVLREDCAWNGFRPSSDSYVYHTEMRKKKRERKKEKERKREKERERERENCIDYWTLELRTLKMHLYICLLQARISRKQKLIPIVIKKN